MNDKDAEKELNQTLSWNLNTILQNKYKKLFKKLNLPGTDAAKAHAEAPGDEVVELLMLLKNKEGKAGLHRFYAVLQELGETESLQLIDSSSAAGLFRTSGVAPNSNTNTTSTIPTTNTAVQTITVATADQAAYLSEMYTAKLEDLAEKCIESKKWKSIGTSFEESHGFSISYTKLRARDPNGDEEDLCKALFHDLAERGISIAELASVLDSSRIGLVDLAKKLRTTAYKKKKI